MTRAALAAVITALLVAAAVPGSADDPALPAVAAQVESTDVPPPSRVVPVNGRVPGTGWELEVDGVFTAPSPDRHGFNEVALAVVLRNTSAAAMPYASDSLRDREGYPLLALRDGAGTLRPYVIRRPHYEAVAGSTLIDIPPGMTARWTIGFQVPTTNVEGMMLLVGDAAEGTTTGVDLAVAQEPAGWPPPPGVPAVQLGEQLRWGDLLVTPYDFGTRQCGDASVEHVVQVAAIAFRVVNTAELDRSWPGTRFPDLPAVATWADGTSGRFVRDTFVGDDDPLLRWADDAVVIPPGGEVFTRAMVFAVPRDGRMGSVTDPPSAVLLGRPDGSLVWLRLDGDGGLALGPAYCDDGLFEFAIPHAFAPGPEFLVGPAGPRFDPTSADIEAQELLTDALIILRHYSADRGSYAGVDAASLEDIWSGVDFVDGFSRGGVGFVGVQADGPTAAALSTQSATGTWFCARDDRDGDLTTLADGEALADVTSSCLTVEEEEAEEES